MASQIPRAVILVVEDEVLIRYATLNLLDDLGYLTFEATDADEAITILEAHKEITLCTHRHSDGGVDGRTCIGALRLGTLAPSPLHYRLGRRVPIGWSNAARCEVSAQAV